MTDRRPLDQPVRETALDPGRSFIVQAPAGSGKTELLTQRFLRLLAVVQRPEEIVAITFTRKAAGEMRDRILGALRRGADPTPPGNAHALDGWRLARAALARDAELGWGLQDNPRRLRIETIDALNAWLARQLPVSSRLGAAPVISDDPEPACRQAARDILLAAGGNDAHAAHAAALLQHLGGRFSQAEDLLVAMLKSRDHWLGRIIAPGRMDPAELRATLDRALANFVADELRRAGESVPQQWRADIAAGMAAAAGQCPELEWLAAWDTHRDFPAPTGAELSRWQAMARVLLTSGGTWRKKLTRNEGFPPTARKAKADMARVLDGLPEAADPAPLARVAELPAPAYDDRRWRILEHLLALLPVAAAALEVEFAARGESDYVGIARAALDALGEPDAPTDLALALDTRISHLLVDEFQDTSQGQVELLARLTAGWTPGDGRSLFCVGDPMQSIYRFREADVGRFIRAQRHGIGDVPLESLQLSVNFRSQAGLVEWVSATFPDIFPAHDDMSLGAVPFAPSTAWNPPLDGPPVACIAVPARDFQAEAEAVRDIIRGLKDSDEGARIAVLVRGRRHLAQIYPALRHAGIPCRAIEIEPLAESPAIRDLEALTRALCHRADRTAWLAVLRAPWCGLELRELLPLAGARDDDIWQRLLDPAVRQELPLEARRRVDRLVAALQPAMAARGRVPLARVIHGAWLALGGPATLERDSELTDAEAFFEFLDHAAEGGDIDDPLRLEERLADQYAAPEATAQNAVELLTIHKAKGLEFDHVILPGLDRTTGGRDKQLLRWLEQTRAGGPELVLAPLEALGEAPDKLHRALQSLDARRDRLELDRLLYVATTRPRRRLFLVAGIKPDEPEHGKAFAPRDDSLLGRLWPATAAAFRASLAAAAAPPEDREPRPPAMLRRLPGDWQAPDPSPPAQWTALEAQAPAAGAVIEYDWSGRQARAVGVVVHRLLQVIAAEGAASWPTQRLEAQRPLLQTLLVENGIGATELPGALAQALAALRSTLDDERGRWLLDASHAQACSELAVSGWIEGRVVTGIIDRSFVDAAGTLWIVDYKAGRHEGGELEAFLDRERERYRGQLERYAQLLAPHHPGPVRLGLFFPQHAGWREWAPATSLGGD
ncbi:exodeoxyribonuclease V subunit beta [Thioalkalivibrio sp. XN279]|uniref:UvrD-helicase domain-containing protein n=1 Tax=Thioalkalivibrio sp. XN279 TaxID=2714953 RepID=UPI00140E7A1A|nr:UvrD-helicase domain-containing protein [Thioalkalivibrio sp. XN279]NHA14468.1 UvrD-helicase domain-containing protein [Thioalkalivibrio sp. XN279]